MTQKLPINELRQQLLSYQNERRKVIEDKALELLELIQSEDTVSLWAGNIPSEYVDLVHIINFRINTNRQV